MSVFIHLSKPRECTKPRMKHNVNYGLLVIMMHQYELINCNKCTTTVVRDFDNRGSCACMRAGDVLDMSVASLNFAINLKLL